MHKFARIIIVTSLISTIAVSGLNFPGLSKTAMKVSAQSETEDESNIDSIMEAAFACDGFERGFIGEPFYDGVIKNKEDAAKAIYSVMDRISGDKNIRLDYADTQTAEDDITFYSFRQIVTNVAVTGAFVKIAVDNNGKALGLVSTLIPGINATPMEEWEIDADDAEAVLEEEIKGSDLEIIHGTTEKALLPLWDGSTSLYYAWVVYTNNDDDDEHAPYLAHYISEDGDYMYSMPVTAMGTNDARSGSTAVFTFTGMEEGNWKGSVFDHNGNKMNVDIPIMIDSETGDQILGDVKRKIICADWNDFQNNDTLNPVTMENGKWDDAAVITYNNFVKIYDFYESIDWIGPDGKGTPMLVLVDALDDDGNPMVNACYSGKWQGFQIFEIDTANPFGESTDIIAHEFTHCYTSNALGTSIYFNDNGAINEAMSDILGNLLAIMIDEKDIPFTMGDRMDTPFRDMGNPRKHEQPEFVWDEYYLPWAAESTEDNDNGGVHTNSSLLNIISYKLDKAGMSREDQFYYWALVDIAMAPGTDYEQIIKILPWMMKILKYDKYLGVLNDAIAATGLSDRSLPKVPPKGYAIIKTLFPVERIADKYDTSVTIVKVDGNKEYDTYPERETGLVAATVEPGDYGIIVTVLDKETGDSFCLLPGQKLWAEAADMDEAAGIIWDDSGDYLFTVKEGDVLELDSDEVFDYVE